LNKYNKKKLIFKYRKKKNIYIKWINGNHIEKNAKSFKKIMLYIKNKYKKLYGGYCLLKIFKLIIFNKQYLLLKFALML
jgi:NRPS condensation-like uncharacterized protein